MTTPPDRELRCPVCRGALAAGPCADPLATCLSCPAGHRFFLLPTPPLAADTARAAAARFPQLEGRPPRAVAAFWLADPAARAVLNEQLAELLRVILEDRHVADEPAFRHCPLCGEPLAEYPQTDIWVTGLRCPNAHGWFSRGGRLWAAVAGARLDIVAEASDATVARLVAAWLTPDRRRDRQLHESVRAVLRSSRFAPPGGA